MYFDHIHRNSTNPPGYFHLQPQKVSTFAFFVSNPSLICASLVLTSMKSFAGACQPNQSVFHATMLFFDLVQVFRSQTHPL